MALKSSPVSIDIQLMRLCDYFKASMHYDMITDEYWFRFKLDPKGVFVSNYRCSRYMLAMANANLEDAFMMIRHRAINGFDVFYIIKECLRVGNMK